VRRFTLITIIVLIALIAGAAVWQIALASRDQPRFPGPEVETPLPSSVAPP
jgi:hypothetical protein